MVKISAHPSSGLSERCRGRRSTRRDERLGAAMTYDIHIIGGGLAGSEAAWQLAEAGLNVRLSEMRGGGDTDAGARQRPAGRNGLLEQLPLRRCREQCRRPAPPGNARARLADHGRGRPAQGARRIGAGGRPRRLRRRSHAPHRRPSQHRRRARADRRPARHRLDDRRHRPADRAGPRRRDRRRDRQPTPSPSSMPSRRSSIATASTWTSAGWPRAGTRAARITSTAR